MDNFLLILSFQNATVIEYMKMFLNRKVEKNINSKQGSLPFRDVNINYFQIETYLNGSFEYLTMGAQILTQSTFSNTSII